LLSLADSKTILVVQPDAPWEGMTVSPSLILGGLLALAVLYLLPVLMAPHRGRRNNRRKPRPPKPTQRHRRTSTRPPEQRNWIVVDGSNVMHWKEGAPSLVPLLKVMDSLKSRGFAPGVVFDANAGWKLFGRYVNEEEFGRQLGLPTDQVLVVPKGTQADPYILATARKFNARIVTNDRYRDWVDDHPEVTRPGFLIRGEMQGEAVRLKGVDTPKAAVS
jgi:hypothetical protein